MNANERPDAAHGDDAPPRDRRYRAFGFRFGVTGTAASLVAPALVGMDASLAPVRRSSLRDGTMIDVTGDVDVDHVVSLDTTSGPTTGEHHFTLSIDGVESFHTSDLGALLHQTIWDITQRAVATRTRSVVLHAGAAIVAGRPVIISGESGAGKSTLVAALTAAGEEYVTDEAVELDDSGHVVDGIGRPIHLSSSSIGLLGSPDIGPADIAMPGGGRYLVVQPPSRRPSDATPCVVQLGEQGGELRTTTPTRADTIASLVRNSFPPAATTQAGLEIVKKFASGAERLTICGGSTADRAMFVKDFASRA